MRFAASQVTVPRDEEYEISGLSCVIMFKKTGKKGGNMESPPQSRLFASSMVFDQKALSEYSVPSIWTTNDFPAFLLRKISISDQNSTSVVVPTGSVIESAACFFAGLPAGRPRFLPFFFDLDPGGLPLLLPFVGAFLTFPAPAIFFFRPGRFDLLDTFFFLVAFFFVLAAINKSPCKNKNNFRN